MKKKTRLVLLILCLCAFLFPALIQCGSPGAVCATAPDEQGYYYTFYEIEPLGIALIEGILRLPLPIYYYRGEVAHSIQP